MAFRAQHLFAEHLRSKHKAFVVFFFVCFLLKNVPLDQLLNFLSQVISKQIATGYQSVLHGIDAFLCHNLLKEYMIFFKL